MLELLATALQNYRASMSDTKKGPARVLNLGGGFAGASLAVKLAADKNLNVALISRYERRVMHQLNTQQC